MVGQRAGAFFAGYSAGGGHGQSQLPRLLHGHRRSSLELDTGTGNTGVGTDALKVNTTGTDNTAVWAQAMLYNQTGYHNTANGYQTLYNTDGSHDKVAIGYQALFANVGGSQNVQWRWGASKQPEREYEHGQRL